MALIKRMSRLFTADVHAVLDRIEEPEALLQHAVREMEEAQERTEQQVRGFERQCALLEGKRRKVRALVAELDAQLDLCLANGTDDLARKVVRRKLEAERLDAQLGERHGAASADLAASRTLAAEQREHLDIMRQKAELLGAAPAHGGDADSLHAAIGDDEVEVALLRERQRRQRP